MLNPNAHGSFEPVPADSRIITETIARLEKEAKDLGYDQKLRDELTQDFIKSARKAEKDLGNQIGAYAGTSAIEILRLKLEMKIQLAVMKRIMEVVLRGLTEDSHREAVKAMKGLRLQDIVEVKSKGKG